MQYPIRIRPCKRLRTIKMRWARGVVAARLRTASVKKLETLQDSEVALSLSRKFIYVYNIFCAISSITFVLSFAYNFYCIYNSFIVFLISLIFMSIISYLIYNSMRLSSEEFFFSKSYIILLLIMPCLNLFASISMYYFTASLPLK